MFVTARRLRYKRGVATFGSIMKIFQSLALLLLLVLLALAWATWDMQRREAAAPGVNPTAFQTTALPLAVTTATAPTTHVPPPAMAVCPTCHGKREVHLENEVTCRACGGDGFIQGATSAHSTTVCNACRGSGKTIKDTTPDCPTCKRTGQITQAMAANFKTCPQCHGAKAVEVDTTAICQNCHGSGKQISEMTKRASGACPFCSGKGKLEKKVQRACPDCFGSGLTYQPPPPPPART